MPNVEFNKELTGFCPDCGSAVYWDEDNLEFVHTCDCLIGVDNKCQKESH